MIGSDIVKNDPNSIYTQYKRIDRSDTIIHTPLIKEPGPTSMGVYYTVSNGRPFAAKCYDCKTFVVVPGIENSLLLLMGSQASAIVTTNHRYYLSPYFNAGTLADLFKRGVKFNHDRLVQFVSQIAVLLSGLHKREYYHGEMLPEHILINKEEDGSTKFGICGFGHYIKKPKDYYEAPERRPYIDQRALDNPSGEHDGACDVWSLGVLVYRLATGKLVEFHKKDLEEIKDEFLQDQEEDDIGVTLAYLILRCVNPDPKERIRAENIAFQPFFIPTIGEVTDYIIGKDKIGTGASSVVRLAKLKSDPTREYAVKILHPLNDSMDHSKMLLLGEISILMMIKGSPYIVKLEDYFEYNGEVHLVLEYCNGGDLNKYLGELKEESKRKVGEVFMLQEVKVISYYLANAIYLLYSKNIVHRDIKPKNILISIDERTRRIAKVKLSDFGTSRELSSKEVTMGTFVGTAKFVAPEVLTSAYTIKMDVWSYGVLLYYLAYGVLPCDYSGAHKSDSAKAVAHPPVPRFALPESFVALIKGCLTLCPADRLSIADVVKHEYFDSDTTAVFSKVPDCYTISPGKPLMGNAGYSVREVTYNLTKAKLVVKILKGPLPKHVQETIRQDVNTLLVLRGCTDVFKLHHSFVVGNDYYFVLDYSRGQTLGDYVKSKPTIPISEIRSIGIAIASAIVDNYERSIRHGKVSAASVYMCGEESKSEPPKAKLAGYSRLVQSLHADEEVKESRDDVYAFGEVLYFLLFKNTAGYRPNVTSADGSALTQEQALAFSVVKRCSSNYYKTPSRILKEKFFLT